MLGVWPRSGEPQPSAEGNAEVRNGFGPWFLTRLFPMALVPSFCPLTDRSILLALPLVHVPPMLL